MNRTYKFILILIAVILVTPISLYIYKFGVGLWDSPTSWSELGSYIGGIYAPILTIITLLVLCVQIYLMQQQNNQSLIQQQEALLSEYLIELNNALENIIDQTKTIELLTIFFQFSDINELNKISHDQLKLINENNHKIYSLWCGINGCINRIASWSPEQADVAKNKVIIYVDPATCRTLDKYIYTMHNAWSKIGVSTIIDPSVLHYWDSTKGS